MPHSSLRLALTGALVLAAFSGCESTRTLRIASDNPGTFSYDTDGTVVLRSEKTHSVAVRIARERGASSAATLPALSVYVTNGGNIPVTLGPENVSAVTGENQPVPVLGRADVASRLRREDQQTATPSYSSSASRSNSIAKDASMPGESGFPKEMSNNTPVYNDPYPSAASVAPVVRVDRSSVGTINHEGVLSPLLVRASIPPGQTGGGTIKLDPALVAVGAPVRVTVSVAGERHEFVFTVQ